MAKPANRTESAPQAPPEVFAEVKRQVAEAIKDGDDGGPYDYAYTTDGVKYHVILGAGGAIENITKWPLMGRTVG